jgi:purine-binding chemotaxis protein CheW
MNLRQLRDDPIIWRILEERAQALARQGAAEDAQLGEEMLTFRLGEGRYSAPARHVREVRALGGYTPLPGTPPPMRGLVNVRGRLMTALDIRPMLALPVGPLRPDTLLLIAGGDDVEVGLVADEVLGVSRSALDLAPALSALEGQPVHWVLGLDHDLAVRIDMTALLADLQRVVGAAGRREGRTLL